MSTHDDDRRDVLLRWLNIDLPIVQAPVGGVSSPAIAAAVSNAGGLGSIGVGRLDVEAARKMILKLRSLTARPFNVSVAANDATLQMPLLLSPDMRPPVISFHSGLPPLQAIEALHAAGIVLLATATKLGEARQMAAAGIDVIVAQGPLALTRRIVPHVDMPVIAASGICNGAGIGAALRSGAAGVQLGSVLFMACDEEQPATEVMARLADELWVA